MKLRPTEILSRLKGWPASRWVVAGALLVTIIAFWWHNSSSKTGENATFTARRGPLNITVLEGGSIRAVDSQEIKCEVRVGYQGIKILKIVEEGYEVTEDDLRTNKVLVELDSSDFQKQIVQQDIQYETAAASLTDAQQNYEIQLNQNLSDIKAAEQKSRFARMDFDRFLGENVTQVMVDQLGIKQQLAQEQTNASARVSDVIASMPNAVKSRSDLSPTNTTDVLEAKPALLVKVADGVPVTNGGQPATNAAPALGNSERSPNDAQKIRFLTPAATPTITGDPQAKPAETNTADASAATLEAPPSVPIDFSKYANLDALGDGEAKQKLRKFDDDLQVSQKEAGQAQATLDGTKRLFEKGFVTRIDLEKDEIARENSRLKVQTAETARDLFLKYEFPKTSEENLSKYAEAVRELVRARKAAVSKLAQAQARLKSAQGQYNIASRQRKELYEQLDKCNISAKRRGLVVYGGAREDMFYYGGEERIREGASVRERQAIITIPDMSKMSVKVKIHESYIKKVKKGQKARITVDAFPDKILDGEVTQVGVLPDSQNMWMNPDLKVYLTTVTIDGTNDWLKPGMSSKVEIFVNRLSDCLYVPVQAVSSADNQQVCFIGNGRKPERRVVEVGEFNDEFIEIKKGLKEGEHVLLRPAETQPTEKGEEKPSAPGKDKSAPAPAAAPVARMSKG
jgi:RND family efflux transporter MFP subunit